MAVVCPCSTGFSLSVWVTVSRGVFCPLRPGGRKVWLTLNGEREQSISVRRCGIIWRDGHAPCHGRLASSPRVNPQAGVL